MTKPINTVDVLRMSAETGFEVRTLCQWLEIPFEADTLHDLREALTNPSGTESSSELEDLNTKLRNHLREKLATAKTGHDFRFIINFAPRSSAEYHEAVRKLNAWLEIQLHKTDNKIRILDIYYTALERSRVKRMAFRKYVSLFKTVETIVAEMRRYNQGSWPYRLMRTRWIQLSKQAVRRTRQLHRLKDLLPYLSPGQARSCNRKIDRLLATNLKKARRPDQAQEVFVLASSNALSGRAYNKWCLLSVTQIVGARTRKALKRALQNAPGEEQLQRVAVRKMARFYRVKEETV